MSVEDLLALLEEWAKASRLVIDHCIHCPTCQLAEALGGQGYCAAMDRMWNDVREAERKMQERLPEFREIDIDVEKIFREEKFQFWKEPQ